MAKAENSKDTPRYDFDDIVIGSGLTGLLIAHNLRHQTGDQKRSVALFEKKEVLGGQYRKLESKASLFPSDLGASVKPENLELWQNFISQSLGEPVTYSDLQVQPKTYDHSNFKNFVGFGDQAFKTIDFFASFNSSNWSEPNLPVGDWVQSLTAGEKPVGQTLHEVTAVEKLVDTKGFKVIVNGGKEFLCERVFFTPAPTKLLDLAAHDTMSSKFVSRLAKSPTWLMASLHLAYKPEASNATSEKQHATVNDFESNDIYFLMNAKSEFEPALGRFFKGPNGELFSYWFTLISPELSEDNEHLGNAIRNIKKTLKRIFPEVSDATLAEKITISSEAFGEMDLKLKAPLEMPDWDGFYLTSHLLSNARGPLAHVDIAHQALQLAGVLEASPSQDAQTEPSDQAEQQEISP